MIYTSSLFFIISVIYFFVSFASVLSEALGPAWHRAEVTGKKKEKEKRVEDGCQDASVPRRGPRSPAWAPGEEKKKERPRI